MRVSFKQPKIVLINNTMQNSKFTSNCCFLAISIQFAGRQNKYRRPKSPSVKLKTLKLINKTSRVSSITKNRRQTFLLNLVQFPYTSVAQPFYTRGTLYIVEESWRHTNPILHIVGRGGGGVEIWFPFSRSCLSSVCPPI
jgi:hypothetical protein